MHSHAKYPPAPAVYAAATHRARLSASQSRKKHALANAGGSAFRSATVLNRRRLFSNAPIAVLPQPKRTRSAHPRSNVTISIRAARECRGSNPFAIQGAHTAISIASIPPKQRDTVKILFVKRRYASGLIAVSCVTKSGTRLNFAPSRTTVSISSTLFKVATKMSAFSLTPNRVGISLKWTRRLNPMPPSVIAITQGVEECRRLSRIFKISKIFRISGFLGLPSFR